MKRLTIALLIALAVGPLSVAAGTVKPAAKTKAQIENRDARTDARARQKAMAAVTTWAIQLRFLDRLELAAAPIDLVVIDHAPHPKKDVETPFTRAEIAPLQVKPDGARRIVLAYLSVGEAERYRYYWQGAWDAAETRPAWLSVENPRWAGNYAVNFSAPEWQGVIFGSPDGYLDRIIAAGFDGVFLDRVDAYQDVEAADPGAEAAMSSFVARLADYARRKNPNFLIVMQNAEELLRLKSLVARIDAAAKEDLLFGHDNSDAENPKQMVQDTIGYLRRARRAGLKVLVLEYAATSDAIAAARALAKREGFVLHVTERMLGTLSLDRPSPGNKSENGGVSQPSP